MGLNSRGCWGNPEDFLKRVYVFLEIPLEAKICHLFAGTVKPQYPNEIRVDLNPAVKPDLLEDATNTSLPDESQDYVLADPAYDKENQVIYVDGAKVKMPFHGPKDIITEMHRLTKPGGYYGLLSWLIPVNYCQDRRAAIVAVTEGANMRIRAFSLFQKI